MQALLTDKEGFAAYRVPAVVFQTMEEAQHTLPVYSRATASRRSTVSPHPLLAICVLPSTATAIAR